MIYDGSSATYRLKTIFSSLLSQSFHLLWYFGGCESLVKLATRRDEDDTKAASYYYTFSLLSFC